MSIKRVQALTHVKFWT